MFKGSRYFYLKYNGEPRPESAAPTHRKPEKEVAKLNSRALTVPQRLSSNTSEVGESYMIFERATSQV